MERRIIATEILAEDAKMESSLRPLHLEDYVGQEKVKRNLKVYIEAAKEREIHLTMCFLWSSWSWKDDTCRNYS